MPTTSKFMSAARKSDKAKKAAAGNSPTEKTPAYEPDIPEPTCRAELIKHWINLSLDDKTANNKLWITENGSKVARMTDEVTCPVLDRPERYEHAPQVLCKEGVLGFRGYWEVECSGWVVVGVAYERAGRRRGHGQCGLGENGESWGLGWSGSGYHAWHDGRRCEINDVPQSSTMGVYLDQPAGVLCFYAVDGGEDAAGGKEVTLLQRFKSPFEGKLLPGLWMGNQSHCLFLKKQE